MSSINSLVISILVLVVLVDHLILPSDQFRPSRRPKKWNRGHRNIRRTDNSLNVQPLVTRRPDDIKCGQSSVSNAGESPADEQSSQNRIFNGLNARPGQFPFQARIQWSNQNCSGVIIDEQSILTSAQCVVDFKRGIIVEPEQLSVFVGDYYAPYEDGEIRVSIRRVRVHIEMLKRLPIDGITNDLALLTTSNRMSWRLTNVGFGSVNRICMPTQGACHPVDSGLFVTGWGATETGQRQSEVLKVAQITPADQRGCRMVWSHRSQEVNSSHICSSTSLGRGAFEGDLGAPLFYFRKDTGQAELVGLASVFLPPDEKLGPNINTRVSHFIDWIENNKL